MNPYIVISFISAVFHNYQGSTAMWISMEGCSWNVGNSTCDHNLSEKNGPQNCFNACPNSTYVGLKENCCMCDVLPGSYSSARNCNFTCRGENKMYCGSQNTTSVYLKALPQPSISIDGEYGYAYVNISGDIKQPVYEFHATVSASEKHKYFCSAEYSINDHSICSLTNGNEKSWLEARDECLRVYNRILAPYHLSYNSSLCSPQTQNGNYWIGMIWSEPKSTTTIPTNSIRTTMSIIRTATTKTGTTITATIETTSMTTPIATEPTNGVMTTFKSPPNLSATSNRTATIVAIPIAVIVVAIAAVLASILICKKNKLLCFKVRRN